MFADTQLAERIERAERGPLADSAERIRLRRPDTPVVNLPIAGGVAVWSGEGSPLNKAAGLGFAGPVAAADLDEIEAAAGQSWSSTEVQAPAGRDPGLCD